MKVEQPKRSEEKISDVHKKVLPFAPAEFRSDAIYIVPTPEDLSAASTKKRSRSMKKKAKLPETRRQKLLEARNRHE